MIDSKDITKMVRHIIRRDHGTVDTHIMHPLREWIIGIVVAIFLTVIGAWFSFVQYQTYIEKRDAPISIIESSVPYQAARVATVIAEYATKRTAYIVAIGNKADIKNVSTTSEPLAETIVPTAPELSGTPAVVESTSTAPAIATTSSSTSNNSNSEISPDASVEIAR